jgi:hypothetical protein
MCTVTEAESHSYMEYNNKVVLQHIYSHVKEKKKKATRQSNKRAAPA